VDYSTAPLDAIGVSSVLILVLRLLDLNGSFYRSVSFLYFACVIPPRDSLVPVSDCWIRKVPSSHPWVKLGPVESYWSEKVKEKGVESLLRTHIPESRRMQSMAVTEPCGARRTMTLLLRSLERSRAKRWFLGSDRYLFTDKVSQTV
jgi:hypothetical protein